MCMVSNITQPWAQSIPQWIPPLTNPEPPPFAPPMTWPTRAEFASLKREVEELKKLLQAAKAFDEATGQPDCEMEEKVEIVKKVAELVGVDLGDIFGD